jgi:hypothetical protein
LILFCLFISAFSQSGVARCTYHLYAASNSLSIVACSDGANGIMKWGYKDLSPMFPYVTAWQDTTWNSPKCGTCIKITYRTKKIYLTVVDQCGKSTKPGTSHFDLSKEAFVALFGQEGIQKGTMEANFELVQPSLCKGNKKRPPQINFRTIISQQIKN